MQQLAGSNISMTIIDGNNWFRRRAETDVMGSPVRNCFYDIQNRVWGTTLVCVVWDGFGGLKQRRDIYPDYKVRRVQAPADHYASQDLFKKILMLADCQSVEVPGYEADDVIAHLVRKYEKSIKLYIESNDLDLHQLGIPMNRQKFPEISRWVDLYKTMVGDPSDNIPGAKGFGQKAWDSLTEQNKQTLEHIIVSGWGLHEEEVREKVKDFFPARCLEWFVNKDNRELLGKFYKIIKFIPMDDDLVNKHMTKGANRPDLAENVFGKYMI